MLKLIKNRITIKIKQLISEHAEYVGCMHNKLYSICSCLSNQFMQNKMAERISQDLTREIIVIWK